MRASAATNFRSAPAISKPLSAPSLAVKPEPVWSNQIRMAVPSGVAWTPGAAPVLNHRSEQARIQRRPLARGITLALVPDGPANGIARERRDHGVEQARRRPRLIDVRLPWKSRRLSPVCLRARHGL